MYPDERIKDVMRVFSVYTVVSGTGQLPLGFPNYAILLFNTKVKLS